MFLCVPMRENVEQMGGKKRREKRERKLYVCVPARENAEQMREERECRCESVDDF